jgi:K+-sensing histidine kinase KdpD
MARVRITDMEASLAGVVLPTLAAVALIPLRDELDNTNVALILVAVVVAVATTGRRTAAALAAITSALAFNFFHTQPYFSFHIESSNDLQTEIYLLLVGLAVGELAAWGRRARQEVVRSERQLDSIFGLGSLVATGEDADIVAMTTASELTRLLGLVDCRFDRDPTTRRRDAEIDRDGHVQWGPNIWESERWGLPSGGVVLPVWGNGRRLAKFVLTPTVGLPLSPHRLRAGVALADQTGAALTAKTLTA